MNFTELLLSEDGNHREIAVLQGNEVRIIEQVVGPEGGWMLDYQYSLKQDHILAIAGQIKSYREMQLLQEQK